MKIKKTKNTKKCLIKKTLIWKLSQLFRSSSNWKEIKHLEKNKIDDLKEDHKEFIKNNKLILKTQQRFKSEKQSVFTEEINKTETNAHRMSKDLVCKREEIKCNNILKQYKNV